MTAPLHGGTDAIQIGGVLYPVMDRAIGNRIPVRRWNDGQLPLVPEFRAGDGYNKKRVMSIDTFVWHWTGGERDPIQMAEVLRSRELGIEFAISRSGTIYQFCDPIEVDTADAGILNSKSIGCEIVCYGNAGLLGIPRLGRDREIVDSVTHGRSKPTALFYPAQVRAALALADAISGPLPIPRKVPDGMRTAFPEPKKLNGHLGHYHISLKKRDPGPWFMDQLATHFAAQGVA